MKSYRQEQVTMGVLHEVTCDICGGRLYTPEDFNIVGAELKFQTGYDWTKFPDLTEYTVDVCEHCLRELVDSCIGKIKVRELTLDD